jgi:hypothetical protein
MSKNGAPEGVIPFAPAPKGKALEKPLDNGDPLDQTGQTVMGMLQQAAVVANENCQHALGVAHKLSLQLREAEDLIKELEAMVRHYQDRAGRAEQWLMRISREIEHRFFETEAGRRGQAPARPNTSHARRQEAAE